MPFLRRLALVLVALAAVAGFGSARASAFTTPPPGCTAPELAAAGQFVPQTLSSAHFDVNYNADTTVTNYITTTQAGDVAAFAEHAYVAYAAMGLPAPAPNPSTGMIEINVVDLSTWNIASVYCSGGAFNLALIEVGSPDQAYSEALDVFTQIENALFAPLSYSDNWLPQSAAGWASWKSLDYPAESTSDLGPFDVSLDCFDTTVTTSMCSKVPFEDGGESRWPFYEYLAERFGTTFIVEVLQDAQAAHSSLAGLQNALVAHGTNLSAVYNAYATKLMAGGWTAASLDVATPPITGEPVLTGTVTGDLAARSISLNHLATRFVEIDRGDGAGDHPCFAATLTITVQIPSGVTSQPSFYWNGGTSTVDLAIAGSTATTTVPWDTCLWSNKGYLSLPNASTNLDSRAFTVTEHLTVDTKTPANATVAPAPASPFGQIVNVPSASQVPAISVFGPELLKLPAGATQIRLIVESSGEGSIAGAIGTLSLGKGTVRPGENDVRFTLPKGALTTLRSTAAAGAIVLSLTPTSADGKATGPAVKQQLSIAPTTKAAAKPKAKAKKTTKTHGTKKKTTKTTRGH